jgi:nicotinic acid mononucleotide adenylyltransferase
LDISSTNIRNSIQGKQKSYSQLIPIDILDYIKKEKLY